MSQLLGLGSPQPPASTTFTPDDAANLTILTNRFARSFSLADYGPSAGYPLNVPLLANNNGNPNSNRPDQQTYDPAVYDSAPALYQMVADLFAAYPMTGFQIMIPPGYWCLNSKPNDATPILTGTAASATSTTIVLDANASSANSAYNGALIRITAGQASGQLGNITGYVGSTKTATISVAWGVTPNNTSVYAIVDSSIIPIVPRMSVLGMTGNPNNTAISRGAAAKGHLFGAVQAGTGGTYTEIMDVWFQYLYFNASNGLAGGFGPYDTIHWEKPTNGSWGDSRLHVQFNRFVSGNRHVIYYSARGDSYIEDNYFAGSGDSMFKFQGSRDIEVMRNIFSACGRHAIEGVDSTNTEITQNECYFIGQNQGNLWDGSLTENVRRYGTGMNFTNCGSIRGVENRIEDTAGGGIIWNSPGTCELTETYWNNLGTLGSIQDAQDGYKDFGFTHLTNSNRNGPGPTYVVDGVDCNYFDRTPSNGNKGGDGMYVTGFARQARSNEQLRSIVYIDPVNNTFKPYTDVLVNVRPGPNELAPVAINPDDQFDWQAIGAFYFWQSSAILISEAQPFQLERSEFIWKGDAMPAIHGRTQNVRNENINSGDTTLLYDLSVVTASATATAATWASGANPNKDYLVTYAVGSDLRSTLTGKMSVAITGMTNALNNGVFNINTVTATTVQVHNYQRSSATGDETGSSGTVAGPSGQLNLIDSYPYRIYRVKITNKAVSAASLPVYNQAGSLLTTLSANGTTKFRFDIVDGWGIEA